MSVGECMEYAQKLCGAHTSSDRNEARSELRCAIKATVQAAVGPGRASVDSGALKMALNVLRRAGKNEVADALEATAIR